MVFFISCQKVTVMKRPSTQIIGIVASLVISLITLGLFIAKSFKQTQENFELPFLQDNETTRSVYGDQVQMLPTKKCDNPDLVTAATYFSNKYRDGYPLPFSKQSAFERETKLIGSNIDTIFEDGVLVSPQIALDTRVIDPVQLQKLTVTEPVPPNSTVQPSPISPEMIDQINRVEGPDTVFESIPGPESENTIPPVQLPVQNIPNNANSQNANRFNANQQNRNGNRNTYSVAPASRIYTQRLNALLTQAGEANIAVQNAQSEVQSQTFDNAAGSIQRAVRLSNDILSKLAGLRSEMRINANGNRLSTAFNQALQTSRNAVETLTEAQKAVTSLTSDNTVVDISTTVILAENLLSDSNFTTNSLQNAIGSVITAQATTPNLPTVTPEISLAEATALANQAANQAANRVSNQLLNKINANANGNSFTQNGNSFTQNRNSLAQNVMNANQNGVNANGISYNTNANGMITLPTGTSFQNSAETVPAPPSGFQ